MFYAFIIQEFMHSAQRITFSAIEKKSRNFSHFIKKIRLRFASHKKFFFAFASLRPWAAKKIRPSFAFALGFWGEFRTLDKTLKKEHLEARFYAHFFLDHRNKEKR